MNRSIIDCIHHELGEGGGCHSGRACKFRHRDLSKADFSVCVRWRTRTAENPRQASCEIGLECPFSHPAPPILFSVDCPAWLSHALTTPAASVTPTCDGS